MFLYNKYLFTFALSFSFMQLTKNPYIQYIALSRIIRGLDDLCIVCRVFFYDLPEQTSNRLHPYKKWNF